MNEKQQLDRALALAYTCVMKLGWSHKQLMNKYGISMSTLRRLKANERGKTATDDYCLSTFVGILNEAYLTDLSEHGGEKSSWFNRAFHDILMAKMGIGVK